MTNNSDIVTKTTEYRPCRVNGKKALFHRWDERAYVVDASPLIAGRPAGQNKGTLAIVEYENGKVGEVEPTEVEFIDNFQETNKEMAKEILQKVLYESNRQADMVVKAIAKKYGVEIEE